MQKINLNNCPTKAPCLKCTERHPGCHSNCGKYLDFRRDLDTYNAMQREDHGIDYVTDALRKKISAVYRNRTKGSTDQ